MLTAADARVRTAVACVPPPTGYAMARRYAPNLTVAQYLADAALMPARMDPASQPGARRWGWWAAITPARVELGNPQQWARGVGSRPFLMLVGRTDEWYTPDEAQQLFDLVPSPTKELVFYDSGHALPPEYAARAVQWFVTHLK
jgi:pimeloyl-ACP methyl ester carboxylesterase